MAKLCLVSGHDELHGLAGKLLGGYLAGDPATTEPWSTLLQQNTPGEAPLTVPLLVAQGETDTLVRPSATTAFVAHECSIGTLVDFIRIPKTGHGLVALRAMPTVMRFFAQLSDGSTPGSVC
jgi:pimeloyl-ACP methyl ester carboxylesterase